MANEFSGPQWCDRYPTSRSTADLTPEFRKKVDAFLSDLKQRGAIVSIGSTYRPPERAYLMHWACKIRDGEVSPADVPAMTCVAIDWAHAGDTKAAVEAANAMCVRYNIAYPAALHSRHTEGRAIDMTVTYPPPNIVALGKSFGVIHLESDKVHWSDDGH